MGWIYIPLCGLLMVTAFAYQLSCPDKLQRQLRGQDCSARGTQTHYICLFNTLKNSYMENCASEDFTVQQGFKKIRKPGITNDNCTVNRYQPITFSTNKFSDCMYTKSSCEEEGQVVVSNRTGYQDRTCRCDYRAGYRYIIQPRNPCGCVPSEEDCSCMRKYCSRNYILSADYKCVAENKLRLTVCSKISTSLTSGTTSRPPNITSLQQQKFSTFTESSTVNASVAIILILLFGIVIVSLFKLRVFPELTSCRITFDKPCHVISGDDKTQTYTVIEGCKVEVVSTYKSLLPCGEIMIKDVYKGEKEAGKIIKCESKPRGMMTGVKRQLSFVVPELTNDNTGTYDLVLKNKIYLPSTLMERWKRFHSSIVNLIYKIDDDKEDSSSNRVEFIIPTLPESYGQVDVFYGNKIELQVKRSTDNKSKIYDSDKSQHNADNKSKHNAGDKSQPNDGDKSQHNDGDKSQHSADDKSQPNANDKSQHNADNKSKPNDGDKSQHNTDNVKKVMWFRLDKDQFTVVQTDKSEDQKEQKTEKDHWVEKHNPSLIINETCMRDGGRYVCFVILDGGEISSYGWELRVIPQESAYKEMQVHEKDTDYVRIPLVSDAKQCLEKNSIVVLKGREGTGKTKMALDLALLLEEKGYLPVIVKSEEDVLAEFDNSHILYIFDQANVIPIFWKEELKRFMSNRQSEFLAKAIFTCRWIDLSECKDPKGLMIDINHGLTEKVKKEILTKYLNRNKVAVVPSRDCNFNSKAVLKDPNIQVKLDHESISTIVRVEPLKGFPLMARQFCNDRHNLHIGEKYFTNPTKDIIKGIAEIGEKASACEASLQEVLRHVILVHITLTKENYLDINKIDDQKFNEAKQIINKDYKPWPQEVKCILVDVKDAANSLLGDYLSCSDNVYEFTHHDLLKAVLSSHDSSPEYIIRHCSLKLILKVIGGQCYKNYEGEVILKLGVDKYSMLIKKLLDELSLKEKVDTSKPNDKALDSSETAGELASKVVPDFESNFPDAAIGSYMYQYWVKEKDIQFCIKLFDYLSDSINRANSEDNTVKILPWKIFMLIKHMTYNGRDSWIYSLKDIPDEIVMFGLLLACQGIAKEESLNSLLVILNQRMSKESKADKKNTIQTKLGLPLDKHGNSFFHYLVLYNDTKGSLILDCCFKDAKGKMKEKISKTKNAKNCRPIDMAVTLGKQQLFKIFWEAKKWKSEKLQKVFEKARKSSHGKQNSETGNLFDVIVNFDHEISSSVHTGSEGDYEAIKEILWK